jgi:hypothetical protein
MLCEMLGRCQHWYTLINDKNLYQKFLLYGCHQDIK